MAKSLDDVELAGAPREQALAAVRKRLDEWGLAMPAVRPLTLDFGLDEFEQTGLIEYWVANETEAGYCGKFLFVFDGQSCPCHRHEVKHETFFVVKGQVRMVVNDEPRLMKEGDLLVMAAGERHTFTGVGDALLLEVSMPSTLEDNFFDDRRIGDDGVI